MRILHVVSSTDASGSRRAAFELSTELGTRGLESEVVALVPGVSADRLPVDVLGTSRSGVTVTWGLRTLMKRFDVTVAHGTECGAVCASTRMPYLARHVIDDRGWLDRPSRPSRAPAHLRKASVVVALSEGARQFLLSQGDLSPAQVRAIPVGIPIDEFQPASDEQRRAARARLDTQDEQMLVVTIGNLVPAAGLDVAIRAVAEVEKAHLLVIGEGSERSRLERLAAGVAVGKVDFAGRLDDVRPALAAADVFAYPAVSGGSMPRVLLEAGLCKLPAVASEIGSVSEIVLDQGTGLLVSPDRVNEWSERLDHLRSTPLDRAQWGQAARDHCRRNFDLPLAASAWHEVLLSALDT